MMYPVSEIWRPIAFTASPPYPLLLQPLPSIRLLRAEDATAAAARGVSPGSCSAADGDSSSCPAPSQSRCLAPASCQDVLTQLIFGTTCSMPGATLHD